MASSSRAERHHKNALDRLGDGDHDAALTAIEDCLAADLTWAASHATHALILSVRGDEAAAARALATAEKLDPDLPYVHFARGIVLDRRDPRRAIEAFRSALAGDPENPRFMLHLGLALARQGDRPEARQLLSRVSELEPEDTLSLMLLADVAIADKNWAEAKRLSETIVKLDPESAEAHNVLAQLAMHDGRFSAACRHAETTLGLDPSSGSACEVLAMGHTHRWAIARPWVRLQLWRMRASKKAFNSLFIAGLIAIIAFSFALSGVSFEAALWLHGFVWAAILYLLGCTWYYRWILRGLRRQVPAEEDPAEGEERGTTTDPSMERDATISDFARDTDRRGRTLH